MAKHYLETGLIIHCEGVIGTDYTLCGAAMEGVRGNEIMTETRASINCSQCITVIKFCQKIRAGELCAPFQRRTRP